MRSPSPSTLMTSTASYILDGLTPCEPWSPHPPALGWHLSMSLKGMQQATSPLAFVIFVLLIL